ncbi:glycoside hydrolase family 2 protein [Loktanella sp. TSTF-M6]|uniref:beta-mannosidase n=1 Tax=Loktanella gaetbuli TaxID=2881335 RepID=A0ABS8BRW0_9RHOB|nr:glycoside hydrolase family 2 protein [Loktanella gaetbuli]MCB5198450.1 glycoside hydrolase family 2 protein [Loktanella gaetbuli]
MPRDLSGSWTLQSVDGRHAVPMTLPGDIVTALYTAGAIPDPYAGQNEYDLRWICEQDWTAHKSFELEHTDIDLVISELDTVATIRVNGTVVLEAANAFRTYRAALGHVARVGTNEIAITFHSPVAAGKALSDAHPFPVPWSKNCPIPYGNFLRKPACDFGWDWNIALATSGVYGALRLEPGAAPRIDRLAIAQDHSDGVTVTVGVHTSNHAGPVTVELDGQTVTAQADDGFAEVTVRIDDPQLWWPAGQGGQPLYDLVVTVGTATAHRRIGLRRMELVAAPDAAGLGFKIRVNGRDVFCKGANWIPADALPGRITDAKTRDLLQSAVDANMNMIRIWGGGRYEPDSFYDACDEMGLLVWQDFMFACNLYPSDPAYLTEVRAEVHDNVARMHHHACLALWCGDNELVGALTWYDVSINDRDRYLVNYDRLNRCIEDALRDTDPHANWWPSSPSTGPLSFGDAWHDDSSGDMHFWSVWHEGRDFDHYRDVSPRFCSEFGFQSYPSMDVIRQFADPADFNIAAPVMEAHQKNDGGNARIAETMFRYFRFPVDFENFVYVSQVQQALAIKTAVTHWRGLKPHCMGTLIWQLNDTWPVCSWASLDYGGGWKVLHHLSREFYAPVTVVVMPDGDDLVLRGINDTGSPLDLSITAYACAMDGTARALGQGAGQVDDHATELLRVKAADLKPQEMLSFGWTASDGSKGGDVFAPKPYKAYDLLPAALNCQTERDGDNWVLSITAQAMAFFVTAEADTPGRFDHNAIHFGPGHTATLRFTPANPDITPSFTLRDLHSATYHS